jgi:hypothetical protein
VRAAAIATIEGVGSGVAVGSGEDVGSGVGTGVGSAVGVGTGVGTAVAVGSGVGDVPGSGTAGEVDPCGPGMDDTNQSATLSFVSMPLPSDPPGRRSRLDSAGGAGDGVP